MLSSYVQRGETPLWTTSFDGHNKCMELLIDAGANVDIPNVVSVVHTSQRPLATELPHVLLTWSIRHQSYSHVCREHWTLVSIVMYGGPESSRS